MFDRFVVSEALKNCLAHDSNRNDTCKTDLEQTSLISLLIHDIFGGEILKTHKNKGWHFYNRIEGNANRFYESDINKSSDDITIRRYSFKP